MTTPRRVGWVLAALIVGAAQALSAQVPAGEITESFHVTLAPSWFDPSTSPPQITPFGVLYAVHDALVRPLPGQKRASLAESWTKPRRARYDSSSARLKFHHGIPSLPDTQVELRALSGRRRAAAPGPRAKGGRVDRDGESTSRRLGGFMTFYGTPPCGGDSLPGNESSRSGRRIKSGRSERASLNSSPGPGIDVVRKPLRVLGHAQYIKRLTMRATRQHHTWPCCRRETIRIFLDARREGPERPRMRGGTRHASISDRIPEQWNPKSSGAPGCAGRTYELDRRGNQPLPGVCRPPGHRPACDDFALQVPSMPYDPRGEALLAGGSADLMPWFVALKGFPRGARPR